MENIHIIFHYGFECFFENIEQSETINFITNTIAEQVR